MKTRMLTHERLLERIHYDPLTGEFKRRPPLRKRKVGQPDKDGYLTISIDGVKHQAHRLAWLYMTGKHSEAPTIDHINRIKSDNRWGNLREATYSENCLNRDRLSPRTGSGIVGVYLDPRRKNCWYVQRHRAGVVYYGGRHKNLDDARAASERIEAVINQKKLVAP